MVNGPNPARTLTRFMLTMYGDYFATNVEYLRKHLHWLGRIAAGL